MKVDTFNPTDDDLRKVAALPFMKGLILPNLLWLDDDVFGFSLDGDARLADRVIRCKKISIYDLLLDEADETLEGSDGGYLGRYYDAVDLRKQLYQNQNQDGLTKKLHDATVLVTFDGPKGAGKSKLAKAMARFVTSLDSPAEAEYHKSSQLADGLSSILETYQRKEKKGEQLPISDLDMDGRLLIYNVALAKIGAEKPAYAFLDRSFITTLAKSWKTAEKNDTLVIDSLYDRHFQDFQRSTASYEASVLYSTKLYSSDRREVKDVISRLFQGKNTPENRRKARGLLVE